MTTKDTIQSDYAGRMLRVLVHIQQNLDRDLPLADLAAVAHFSPFHFHRVFRGIVGESVMQHIRRLRLERAAMRLKHGRLSITSIALEAGYDAHEAFTRAFRRAFDCSPSEFRTARSCPSAIASPANAHYVEGAAEIAFRPLTLEDTPMDVDIRSIDPMRVAFVRHVGPYDRVGEAWERLCELAGVRGLLGPESRLFGACYDDPEVTPPEKIRYDACITVDERFQAEGELGVQTQGGGRYAVALHEGPYERLGETYAAVLGPWFASSRCEPGPPPCLEFYLNDPESTPPDELLTEVCVRTQD